jgi:arylsulfate sulfotransferase
MIRALSAFCFVVCMLACDSAPRTSEAAAAGRTIELTADLPSPQPVGQPIVWRARVAQPGPLVYRFSVRRPGGPWLVIRDFTTFDHVEWAPLDEGRHEVMVTVKPGHAATGGLVQGATFDIAARVSGGAAGVFTTRNPLVALYSAPACRGGDGAEMHVEWRRPGDAAWASTSAQPCSDDPRTRNFLVAGMLEDTAYELRHVVTRRHGEPEVAPPLRFSTGRRPRALAFPAATSVLAPLGPRAATAAGTAVVMTFPKPPANAVSTFATDLAGHLDWYYDPLVAGLTVIRAASTVAGGTLLLYGRDTNRSIGDNVYREVDLASNTLQETNLDQINAQLARRGGPTLYEFHHEAQRLAGGRTALLGQTQATVSVGGARRNYAIDVVVVVDRNLQVVWTWNALDALDITNTGLGEICVASEPPGFCAVPDPQSLDWTHVNSVKPTPDGNLLVSVRSQDLVIKVAYADGTGDGHVIWRFGKGGDFTLEARDPSPWPSHQHDARYVDDHTIVLLDNGNTRCGVVAPEKRSNNCPSRGQAYVIDERTMTARQVLNATLPFSHGVGSAQRLANGNYVFDAGLQYDRPPLPHGQSIELAPDGETAYALEISVNTFRTYRLASLYEGSVR